MNGLVTLVASAYASMYLKPFADFLSEVGAEPAAEGLERVGEVVDGRNLSLDPGRHSPVTRAGVVIGAVLPETILVHVEHGVDARLRELRHLYLGRDVSWKFHLFGQAFHRVGQECRMPGCILRKPLARRCMISLILT